MIRVILTKLWSIISLLLYPCKRALCWIKRSRKSSGTILPLANHYPAPTDYTIPQSVPTNDADLQLEPWDNWEVTDTTSNHPNHGRSQLNSAHVSTRAAYQRSSSHEPDVEPPDVDYFNDMQPSITKSKKIILKKSGGHSVTDHKTSVFDRLAASSVSPVQGSELAEWEEGGSAWDEELIDEDLSQQADLAIKEKRRQEREQRQLENQRRKMEKQHRNRGGDNFTIVKLS